jgi:pimeloyl-ACP methyl ester carboxylesterase
MDNLLDHFVLDPKSLYPNLEAITIAGHSAGGQFVQRYALLSSYPALDASLSERRSMKMRSIQIRLVAANPRSYCYLDDRRYAENDGYKRPSGDKMEVCPRWNEYQWGLDDGGDVVASYRDRAIELVGGTDALRKRFLQRNVTYLAGTKDILPLEGMCEDDLFQGGCRLERAHHYFDSLALFNTSSKNILHQLHEVPGSNHDHTFMFQLSLEDIFGQVS